MRMSFSADIVICNINIQYGLRFSWNLSSICIYYKQCYHDEILSGGAKIECSLLFREFQLQNVVNPIQTGGRGAFDATPN